ncbi:MAG: D-tyrosyl-tRNA(Tyr) deacylase [Spirochaetaceae bacterium]|nr:D-tyrosyl-tRNA(Tyr) deacylase [Spirochaetaceae bacterium]
MKVVLQRVSHGEVEVEGEVCGKIGRGYVALVGFGCEDEEWKLEKAISKIKSLRVFPDENGKINLSIDDISGELLLVSQFTLYADCKKGNRPGFSMAMAPDKAEAMFEKFVSLAKPHFSKVQTGIFGAHMKVSLLNDGPFTIILDF